MAGSNGVIKILGTNRESQVIDLKTRGGTFRTEDKLLLHKDRIEAEEFLEKEIYLDSISPSGITLADLRDIFDQYSKHNKVEIGAGFYTTLVNTDANNIKTINLPTGITFFDTGFDNIPISANTRVVLYSVITNITGTPGITIYTASYSGMSNVISSKQGAIHVPANPGNYCIYTKDEERALWVKGPQPGIPPVGSAPSNIQRTGTYSDPDSFIEWHFTFPGLATLASNPSSIAGAVITSVTFHYFMACEDPVSFGSYFSAHLIASLTADPLNIPRLNTPFTTDYPLLKPATPGAAAYHETLTLDTPLQVTDAMAVNAIMYSPAGGMPNSNVVIGLFGATFYVNYQYSV